MGPQQSPVPEHWVREWEQLKGGDFSHANSPGVNMARAVGAAQGPGVNMARAVGAAQGPRVNMARAVGAAQGPIISTPPPQLGKGGTCSSVMALWVDHSCSDTDSSLRRRSSTACKVGLARTWGTRQQTSQQATPPRGRRASHQARGQTNVLHKPHSSTSTCSCDTGPI